MKKRIQKYQTKLVGKTLNLLFEFAPDKAVEKSLDIFLSPRKGRITEEAEDFLKHADKRELIEIEGTQIQTYFWGKGSKKILLVHGWESNTYRWKSLIELLPKEDFTIISLDAPAHGNSTGKHSNVPLYTQAIEFLIRTHQIQYAVGHSLGGFTLLFHQSLRDNSALEKMVLLAPAVEMQSILRGFQRTLNLKPSLMEKFDQRFEEKYRYKLSEFSFLNRMGESPVATLFIHDKEDRIVPYKETENLVNHWGSADLMSTQGLRHGLRSEKIDESILEYFKK